MATRRKPGKAYYKKKVNRLLDKGIKNLKKAAPKLGTKERRVLEEGMKAFNEMIDATVTRAIITLELDKARRSRAIAYEIGVLPDHYLQGKKIPGGEFRNCNDDIIRRHYADLWVVSMLKIHTLILGLPPEDETEKKFPLKAELPPNPGITPKHKISK